jgi:polyisoprenyl-teichoic acid--peptidoglycan teichoic acid transferase
MDDEPTIKLTRRPDHPAEPPSTPPAVPVQNASAPPRTPPMPAVTPPQTTPEMPTVRIRKNGKKRRNPTRIALTIFLAFLVLVGAVFAAGYYFYYQNVQEPVAQFVHPVSRGSNEPQIGTTPSYDAIDGRSWNLLLMGSDNDGKYTFPAVLTQVMMVIHVDTANKTVNMVSIPRDSWVPVPQIGGMHKIDQAFFLGVTQHDSFDDGVRSARLTIESDYGIPIDRYAWVGLSGFAKVIDTLGGVDIDATHPVVDDNYPDDTGKGSDPHDPYAYKRLYITPGPQHMNGSQALDYVRSRHSDLVGDIGRTQRQQQVLQALKQKLNVGSVIDHLPDLLKDMRGQVYTDLSEQEMLAFANFGRTLDSKSINRITLGPGSGSQDFGDYQTVYDPAVGANQDVIIPNCANIQPVVSNIFQLGILSGGCNVSAG